MIRLHMHVMSAIHPPPPQTSGSLTTALHEAAETNSLAAVQYLLSVGAQTSIQNALGEIPFDCSNTLEIKQYVDEGSLPIWVGGGGGGDCPL